jgi:cytochrome d ubiquinol oxidase subunit II
MMYVVMDGFDLGIGILFPFVPARHDRDVMMNTVAPVWDGNDLAGAGRRGPAGCVPAGLFRGPVRALPADRPDAAGADLRGVAFEFRFKANDRERPVWDLSFMGGSLVAAFFQGWRWGLRRWPARQGRRLRGQLHGLARPFPLFCGVGVVVAYTLLGGTWLILKTEGPLHDRMKALTSRLVWALLAIIAVISIWTPIAQPRIAERWFSLPNLFWFAPVPLLVLLCAVLLLRALRRDTHAQPFLFTLGLVFLGYSGLAISVWPNIVPPSVSIWAAAAPPQSQGFALVARCS